MATPINMTHDEANARWRVENDAGRGYAVGDDDSDINDLDDVGTLLYRSETTDQVAVYLDGDTIVAVGDAHGPWACDIGFVPLTAFHCGDESCIVETFEAPTAYDAACEYVRGAEYAAGDAVTVWVWEGGTEPGERVRERKLSIDPSEVA